MSSSRWRWLAGGGSVAAAFYVSSEYREWRRRVEDSETVEARLPKPEVAQATRVVNVSGLLSLGEIEEIDSWARKNERRFGSAGRTAQNGAAAYKTGAWETLYLHTNGLFRDEFPDVLEKMRKAAVSADSSTGRPILAENGGSIPSSSLQPRCVELHVVKDGGGLPYPHHHDAGSVLTVDVMVADQFEGGEFQTLETDGRMKRHVWNRAGDALVFQSCKPHCVNPVTKGERRVLIVEFWQGLQRTCAHRCDFHYGHCPHTTFLSFWRRALANLASDEW